MSTAVWRPTPDEAYPVIAIRDYSLDGQHVDIVTYLPGWTSPDVMLSVPMRDIHLRPRSIVRALTADFTDHSAPDRCRCAERAEGPLTPLSLRAQAGAGGEAAPATNFQQ